MGGVSEVFGYLLEELGEFRRENNMTFLVGAVIVLIIAYLLIAESWDSLKWIMGQ